MGTYRVGYNLTTRVISVAAWDAVEGQFNSSTVATSLPLTGVQLPEVDGSAIYNPSFNTVTDNKLLSTSFHLSSSLTDTDGDGIPDSDIYAGALTITIKKVDSSGTFVNGSDSFVVKTSNGKLSVSEGKLGNGRFNVLLRNPGKVGVVTTITVSPQSPNTAPAAATYTIKWVEKTTNGSVSSDAVILNTRNLRLSMDGYISA